MRRESISFVLLWSAALSCAAEPLQADAFDMQRVPDEELAQLRGGFVTSDGLEFSVGLQQLVLINGAVQAGAGLTLSSPRGSDINGAANLIPYGIRGDLAPSMAGKFDDGLFTIIQNEVDGQVIQNYTVLNIAVTNASQFRADALGEVLDLQLSLSLR